jgi:transposase
MDRAEAEAIFDQGKEATVEKLLELSKKAEQYDRLLANRETAPSGSKPPYEKENIHRSKKGRKRPGRKKGHPGASRKMPEAVDGEVEHTLSLCPHCGQPLGESFETTDRTIEDIPPPKARVIRHRKHRYWCCNCNEVVEPVVIEALPGGRIGLNVLVLGAWMHYAAGMSLGNLVRLFRFASGLPLTPSGLIQAWRRIAEYLEPYYEQIRKKVQNARALHADETGWRVSGITYWLWCFATKAWCFYVIRKDRSRRVVRSVLGDLLQGILICDFWGAYNAIVAIAKQRCLFHLFTELLKVDKRNKTPQWTSFRRGLKRLLKDGIRLAANRKVYSDPVFARRKQHLLDRLDAILHGEYQDRDSRRLVKRLRRHRDEIFTFLDYPEVSPFNNHGEQQMRKPVQVRRISHGNRSDRAAHTQEILMTLFRSMELQGRDPIKEVLRLVQLAVAGKTEELAVALERAA